MTVVVLRGGTVIDGVDDSLKTGDLILVDGRVAEFCSSGSSANVELRDAQVFDMTGLTVVPGFVDVHTHSDCSVLAKPDAESKILQGVTTEVIGNCSFSPFPGVPEKAHELDDHLSRLGGPGVPSAWADLDAYADAVSQSRPSLNVAALVGHGALRIAVMQDPYAEASEREIAAMCDLLAHEMQLGALGFSTGLTHTPSSHGQVMEIQALARVCAAYDGVYATHSRATADNEFGAVEEAIEVAAATRVRLEYSHAALNNPVNWGSAARVLELFHQARDRGLEVGFDVYPYTASSSALLQYLPEWVQAGGGPGIAAAAKDSAWQERALADIRLGWFGGIAWLWDRVIIVDAPGEAELVGLSIEQIAAQRQQPQERVLLDLCVRHGSAIQAVMHYRVEEDVQAFLSDPLGIVASDGLALPLTEGAGRPHPRSFGTFARVLGRYVRDLGVLGLPEAVRKLSVEPARRFRIPERGTLTVGAIADIAVFDHRTVKDMATFEHPRQAPVGMTHTFVSGELVAQNGQVLSGRGSGTFLRRAGV